MSSLANAIKRRTHKERAQPAVRRKYGLLEKKKDYLLRAKDFHKKEKAIKTLRRKAEERNPDEFYFAMEKARTKEGVHVVDSGQPNKYSQEQLRLMKTQDVKYLGMKTQAEARKVAKLKERLHFIGAPPQNKHTVFVDSPADAAAFSAARYFDTPEELVGRVFNRPRMNQLEAQPAVGTSGRSAPGPAKLERQKHAAYKELAQRTERQHNLQSVSEKMAYEKQIMGKGRKRKLGVQETGTHEPVYKWKRERLR